MEVRCLVIGGTLAPGICERLYYGNIMKVPEELGIDTLYTSIQFLGLGDVQRAVDHIAQEYLVNQEYRYVLIGHSQGAIIASCLAMLYPDQVMTVIALAGPYRGTAWTDPQSMVTKIAIEAIDQISGHRVRLKPKLPRSRLSKLVGNLVPVVRGLSADSEVLLALKLYLESQTTGPITHSIIANDDRFVIPSRSAHPSGPMIRKYLAAHPDIHHHLHGRIPEEIELLAFKAGHILMVNDLEVLSLIEKIILAELAHDDSR